MHARLRSPFGGPSQTFETLERMLGEATESSTGDTAPMLLHFLEQLEVQIYVAHDGTLSGSPPSRGARLFFLNNKCARSSGPGTSTAAVVGRRGAVGCVGVRRHASCAREPRPVAVST